MFTSHNLLRPETIESLFYAYQVTKDENIDYAYDIFQAIEQHTKIDTGGYSSIFDVEYSYKDPQYNYMDKMETFYLAETLKYLYLLFDDQQPFDLNQWVFNTEAHPFLKNKIKFKK